MAVTPQNIGLFGGSFDPIHKTHLSLAEQTIQQFRLKHLYLVPAARNPLKVEQPLFHDATRLALCTAATSQLAGVSVLDWEIQRPPPSYTIDTVRAVAERHPDADLHLLIGADLLEGLPQWKEIDELTRLVRFIVFPRPGFPLTPPGSLPSLHLAVVDHPLDETSATEIRDRLAHEESVEDLIPEASIPVLRQALSSQSCDSSQSCMIEHPQMSETLAQIEACCRVLDDRKATDIRVLHVGPVTSVADYFIVASGTSTPHLRALREKIADTLLEMGITHTGADARDESGWVVIDAYSFMVHLFLPEQRKRFGLESLWKDAELIQLPERAIA